MKKIFASIAGLMMMGLMTTANAQAVFTESTSDQFRIGVQLGLNIPTFGESQYGATIGYNMGATALFNTEDFIPDSYLRASVLYSRKGASADEEYLLDNNYNPYEKITDATYYLHYTEIPIRFGYAYEVNSDVCVMAETGPYFGMRWTASLRSDNYYKYNKETSNYVQTSIRKDKRGNDLSGVNCDMNDMSFYKDLRRFDWGWGLHAGVLLGGKYQVMVGYDWGLCDAVPDVTSANRNFSINVGVFFD